MAGNETLVRSKSELVVVGIGASAGGVQALRSFFEHVAPDSDMAYVVILHLSPDYNSQLAEVLQMVAKIPIIQVRGKVKVEPNHVYVISPNHHLTMQDGSIESSENKDEKDRRAPVDIFFRTLAESHGSNAICVVLSGTGADGSMGLKRIKENGGVAFVQDPSEAEFGEMPNSSIATQLVDDILPITEIPAKIAHYKNNLPHVHIPMNDLESDEIQLEVLHDIFKKVKTKFGHDFSNYKRPTVLRRIERRLNVRNQADLISYSNYLEQNPAEITALLKDLLISVTNFFRDPAAFHVLETEIIPDLISKHAEGTPIRIWVAGCATGEEAYSIAMLCAEQITSMPKARKIQIFATDIDEDAIMHAREGIYTFNETSDVSEERLNRFFYRNDKGYVVEKEIRDMVLFATHNFIKDPPFSKLDLVSCRNVLIYLNKSTQQRVLETFHFALKPENYLFLGSSESIEGASDLFSVFNRERHFFQTRAVSAHIYPVPESVPAFRYDAQPQTSFGRNHKPFENITLGDVHQQILDEITPASILINQEFEILHISGKAGRFLQIGAGEPTKNILGLILPDMRLELHTALNQVIQKETVVDVKNQKISYAGVDEIINIRIRPVSWETNTNQGYIVILFESAPLNATAESIISLGDQPVIQQLDGEVIRLKAQLKNSIGQHEFRTEELKASNEELQAMNEELHSAAEELETSKEELQSINEELRTVNQELKIKIEETILSNNNLHNLINSSDIGTIFLDKKLNLAFFTPAVKQIFNLIAGDRGRPLSDITHGLNYHDFLQDAGTVLRNLQPIEKEVEAWNERKFLMRLSPYRTEENGIDGVVVTFVDITSKALTENELRISKERLQSVTNLVPDLLWTNSPDGLLNWFNHRWVEYSGNGFKLENTQQAIEGWSSIVHPDDFLNLRERWEKARESGQVLESEFRLRDADGLYKWHIARNVPLRDQNDKIVSWFGSATDVDILKRAQHNLSVSEERYRIALQSAGMIAWDWDVTSDELIWNENSHSFAKDKGMEKKIVLLQRFVHPDDQESLFLNLNEAVKTGNIFQAEFRISNIEIKDSQWFFAYGTPVSTFEGKTTRMAGVMYNITQRKVLENQKDEFLGIASHELKTPVTSIKAYADVLQDIILDFKDVQTSSLVEKLVKQVDRLTGLINNLLDTTKIFERQLKIDPVEFQMNEIIREKADDMQPLTKKHTIILKLEEHLPPIHADKDRIRQVLTNLISNAIKYSPAGGEIVIRSDTDGKDINVSVQDSGIGIPESQKKMVFNRFFRVNNPVIHSFPGMGLGLYIVAGIIHQHGGRILVDEQQSVGTLIYFTLPLAATN